MFLRRRARGHSLGRYRQNIPGASRFHGLVRGQFLVFRGYVRRLPHSIVKISGLEEGKIVEEQDLEAEQSHARDLWAGAEAQLKVLLLKLVWHRIFRVRSLMRVTVRV